MLVCRIMDEAQNIRADLRKNFLQILKSFEGEKSAEVRLVNGEILESTKILAFDREIIQMIVTPLKTPNGEKLESGILRLTDVESVTISAEENLK